LDAVRIYKLLAKFGLSSFGSALLDIAVFALVTKLILPVGFPEAIAIGTVTARVLSSLFNYSLNRRIVFCGPQARGTMLRYYILAVFQMLCSLFLVRWLAPMLGWDPVGVKLCVDVILFMLSFRIQQKWVFGNAACSPVVQYRP
jgi:putative flippase GtrA